MGPGRAGSGRAGSGREYSDFPLKYERTRSARCARSLVINPFLVLIVSLDKICAASKIFRVFLFTFFSNTLAPASPANVEY